ncbi:MAG: tetratricopeptide repeat protein [Brachymonas sp.]
MRQFLARVNGRFLSVSALALVCFSAASSVWADDYSDISRMLRAGQLVEANTKVDQLLATKSQDPQIRFFKGVIQSEQGRPQDAINTFTKLTQDYPELPEPYNNLAVLYAGQSQFDKARAALEMAIRTNPSYATAHENLGDIYAKLASQAYSKALQLDASNAGVQPKLSLIKDIFAPGSKTVRVASNKAATSPSAASPATSPAAAAATSAKVLVPAVAAPVAATPATAPTTAPVAKRPTVVAAPPLAANTTKPAATSKTDGAEAKDPANTPPAAKNDDEQAVEAAVRTWARAWAKKDMRGYYAAYGSNFRPADGASRSAWEADRKARIVSKNKIQVEVSNIRVTINGDKATARFRQDYQGDALRISSNKSLAFSKEGQRWVIAREMAGN